MTITLKDSTNPRIVIADAGNNVLIGSDITTITSGSNINTLGIGAGAALTSATDIVAIGQNSLTANSIQSTNISIGTHALVSLNDTTGVSTDNVVIGHYAMRDSLTDALKCIAIGSNTLAQATISNASIIAIGYNAAHDINALSTNNIFIGDSTGASITKCNSCTFIGDSTTSTNHTTLSNSTALGANVSVNVSNAVNIGSGCFVGLNQPSPAYSLDMVAISNVCAIKVADSSSTPATPSGAALYYSVSGIPTYMNSNAVALAIPHRTSVTVSATSKTFALTDSDTFQVTTSGSTTTLTVPTNASVAFPIDTEIDVFQQGTGQVVFAAAGGVTIQSMFSNLKIGTQYSGATLKKLGTDTWALVGNLTA